MRLKSNISSKFKNKETISSFVDQFSMKKTNFFLNPNINYVFGIYVILIIDSLTKLAIRFRIGQKQDDFHLNITQIIVYIVLILTTFIFEIFFKKKRNERFYKYNDFYYLIVALLISVCLLEERIKWLKYNNNLLTEGCKIMLIHFVWMGNFIEIWFIILCHILNIIYLVTRVYETATENLLILFFVLALFVFQIFQRKHIPGISKYKDSLNRCTLTSKKNLSTYLEENEFETSHFNDLFENLLNNSSDGFILFDHKMQIIFNNSTILDLFRDFKNEILNLKIYDLDQSLQKLFEDNKPKNAPKLMNLRDILKLDNKQSPNILDSISYYDEKIADNEIHLDKALELLSTCASGQNLPSNKLVKLQDHSFHFKMSKNKKNDPDSLCSGGIIVFTYKLKKIFLVCFKKESLTNKVLDNFNKVLEYISNELTNSLNCLIIMLQMLQTSTSIPKKLINDYVNPALISTKFLINLKNEMSDSCDILRGKINKNLREFNLKNLALEIISLFTFQCESRGIDISLKYDERIPMIIKSDPRFISQILTTLTKHSIKYCFKNSIYIKIELESGTNYLKISVSYSGHGLSKDEKSSFLNTFSGDDYFNSFNFDPYNIGYDIFSSHILALLLSPEDINQKGLSLISEQGYGCSYSFYIEDLGELENLRECENEEENIKKKYENFVTINSFENKFIKKNLNKNDFSFQSNKTLKNRNVSHTVINPKRQDYEPTKTNNSMKYEPEIECKSNKYTFNEFSKCEENTFNLPPSNFHPESEISDLIINARSEDKKISSVSARPPGRLSVKSPLLDLKFGKEGFEDYSSIYCSKLGSDMVWSFSSDSQILKEMSEFNVFEDKLRQIKEINKIKKCSCVDILICDDDEMSNYSIKNVLASLGFSSESVAFSSSAIEFVQKKMENSCCKLYKMIFIYNNMPDLSGYETCKFIRKIHSEANLIIPGIIAMTKQLTEKEQNDIKKAGFLDYICKPLMQNTINFYIKKYINVDLVKRRLFIVQN